MAQRIDESQLLVICLVTAISLSLALFVDRGFHWFIIPVAICGATIGRDGVAWLRSDRDLFDPAAILGLLGIHFFFVAPLLHVAWDVWMGHIVPPADWRQWLGGMAVLNGIGLLLYRLTITRTLTKGPPVHVEWRCNYRRFIVAIIVALLFTGVLQFWVYVQYGGVLGYITAYSQNDDAFRGMGWIFLISESFPILAMMGTAVWLRRWKRAPSWLFLAVILCVFLVLKLYFGGLRGSRSNTVWGLFWAVGILHFWVRPIPRKLVLGGLGGLLLFMYGYGFYKGAGLEGVRALGDAESRTAVSHEINRSVESTLLSDLGRADIQALILQRLITNDGSYEYAYGRTYIGALALLIPRSVWPNRPPGKSKEGTEVQYGPDSYRAGWTSSRVYGISGEAMLNFGPLGVPLALAGLGLLVRSVRSWMSRLSGGDIRWLLAPFLINLCFVVLSSDSDNVLFFFVKNGAIPCAILFFGADIRRSRTYHAGGVKGGGRHDPTTFPAGAAVGLRQRPNRT